MLLQSWEGYATQIANVPEDALPDLVNSILQAEDIDLAVEAQVAIARDTRYISPCTGSLALPSERLMPLNWQGLGTRSCTSVCRRGPGAWSLRNRLRNFHHTGTALRCAMPQHSEYSGGLRIPIRRGLHLEARQSISQSGGWAAQNGRATCHRLCKRRRHRCNGKNVASSWGRCRDAS